MKTLYMKLEPKDVAKYVLFSGDPFRVDMLVENLENVRHIGFHREFNTYTGTYKGVEITVTSTGIGAPSAAIAMEELYECGMQVAVRMGTVMGLKDDYLGKLIIPAGAMREEATSKTYAPVSFPAVADPQLISCMNEATKQNGREYVNGINCTLDGFYSQMKESKLSKKMNTDILSTFERLKRYNVDGIDMESACMLTLGRLMDVSTCIVTMTTVLTNLKKVLEGEERTKSEKDLCKIALDGIVIYDGMEK